MKTLTLFNAYTSAQAELDRLRRVKTRTRPQEQDWIHLKISRRQYQAYKFKMAVQDRLSKKEN